MGYCCCTGCACTSLPRTLNVQCNCCCCAELCRTVDCWAPSTCTCVQKSCCCAIFAQLPTRDGNPRCICFGNDYCGVIGGYAKVAGRGGSLENVGFAEFDNVLFESPLTPCYLYCCGVSCSSCLNVYSIICKCFNSKCSCNIDRPNFKEGLCSQMCSCWYCHSQCKLPPEHRLNPICA